MPSKPESKELHNIDESPTQDWSELPLSDLIDKYYHGAWDGSSQLTSHRDYTLVQKEIIENMVQELEETKGFDRETAQAMAAQVYIQYFAKDFKRFDSYSN